MEYNELRIGNLVDNGKGQIFTVSKIYVYKGKPSQIKTNKVGIWKDNIYQEKGFDKILPININHEVLIGLGFETKNKKIGWYSKSGFNFTIRRYQYDIEIFSKGRTNEPPVKIMKYAHELQNFYYTFKREELIINL